jgi:hypothetical protein
MEIVVFGSWICLAVVGVFTVSIGLWIVNKGERDAARKSENA